MRHAEMQGNDGVFDTETHGLVNRLHAAWSAQAPVSEYAAIRDRILARQDQIDTSVAVLCSVVKVAHGSHLSSDAEWQDLFTLAEQVRSSHAGDCKKRKRTYNESNRLRNLALVAALWSLELVIHYGWDNASQVQMNMIRACAVRYPRFGQDFRPRLNAVLLERHCSGVKHGRTKTLNEVSLQPHRDLDLINLNSVVPDDAVEARWITSTDGQLPVDDAGTLLRDLRPEHFHMYLLQRDKYGVLRCRSEDYVPPTLDQPAVIDGSCQPAPAKETISARLVSVPMQVPAMPVTSIGHSQAGTSNVRLPTSIQESSTPLASGKLTPNSAQTLPSSYTFSSLGSDATNSTSPSEVSLLWDIEDPIFGSGSVPFALDLNSPGWWTTGCQTDIDPSMTLETSSSSVSPSASRTPKCIVPSGDEVVTSAASDQSLFLPLSLPTVDGNGESHLTQQELITRYLSQVSTLMHCASMVGNSGQDSQSVGMSAPGELSLASQLPYMLAELEALVRKHKETFHASLLDDTALQGLL